MSTETSFIDLPLLYAFGLRVLYTSNTTVTISSGQARTQFNEFDAIVPSNIVINSAVKGANGLDIGTIAANTWYAVHLIYDNTLNQPTAGVISCQQGTTGNSFAGPIIPFGYSNYRRVGYVRTDSSANFIPFDQAYNNPAGSESTRYYQWRTPIQILDGGTSTTYASLGMSTGVPYNVRGVINLAITFASSDTNATGSIRPTGSSSAAGSAPINFSDPVAPGIRYSNYPALPFVAQNVVGGFPSLDYIISAGELDIWVSGFYDTF